MVLVDSSHEDQEAPNRATQWQAAIFQRAALRRFVVRYGDAGMEAMCGNNQTIDAVNDELAAIAAAGRESTGIHPRLGDAPLVILTAGRNDGAYWRELQRELLRRSHSGWSGQGECVTKCCSAW